MAMTTAQVAAKLAKILHDHRGAGPEQILDATVSGTTVTLTLAEDTVGADPTNAPGAPRRSTRVITLTVSG